MNSYKEGVLFSGAADLSTITNLTIAWDAGDGQQGAAGGWVQISECWAFSFQFTFTATTGSLNWLLDYSDDGVLVAEQSGTKAITAAGGTQGIQILGPSGYKFARLNWVYTSGTVSLKKVLFHGVALRDN